MRNDICILCFGISGNGGLERVVCNLANEFCNNDYKVTICVCKGDYENCNYTLDSRIVFHSFNEILYKNNNFFCRCIGKFFRKTNIKLLYDEIIKKKIYFPQKRVNLLEEYLEKNNYDSVIAIGCELSILLSCINRRKIKTQLIGWHHNSYFAYFEEKGKYCCGMSKLAFNSYSNLDKLVLLTKKDQKIYEKNGVKNSTYIYNPLSFTSDAKSSINNRNIIFVGRLEWRQKGLDYFIKIVNEVFKENICDNWKIIIAGDGPDSKRLKKYILHKKLNDKIIFLGKVSNIKDYYKKSDILLNTSRWEGFGLVITEAMECGVPVISFDTDGPNEIISNGIDGYLIEKYNINEFSNRIIELIKDEKKRKQFSIQAIKKANKFKINKIFEKWEELIQNY